MAVDSLYVSYSIDVADDHDVATGHPILPTNHQTSSASLHHASVLGCAFE
jgi:hypothetical protein